MRRACPSSAGPRLHVRRACPSSAGPRLHVRRACLPIISRTTAHIIEVRHFGVSPWRGAACLPATACHQARGAAASIHPSCYSLPACYSLPPSLWRGCIHPSIHPAGRLKAASTTTTLLPLLPATGTRCPQHGGTSIPPYPNTRPPPPPYPNTRPPSPRPGLGAPTGTRGPVRGDPHHY